LGDKVLFCFCFLFHEKEFFQVAIQQQQQQQKKMYNKLDINELTTIHKQG